jgi:hypothetical protein
MTIRFSILARIRTPLCVNGRSGNRGVEPMLWLRAHAFLYALCWPGSQCAALSYYLAPGDTLCDSRR